MTEEPGSPRHLQAGVPAESTDLILARRHRVATSLAPPRGGTLLDFGCGNGAQTLWFLPSFDRCIGVDIQPASLERFRAACDQAGYSERVQLIEGESRDVADRSVDYLTSFEVLEHVEDEGETLAEWRRLLRDDGQLVVSVPNRWWVFETHGAKLPLLPWNRVPFFSWLPTAIHDRWAHARIYTRGRIESLLREAGFEVNASVYVTAPMDVLLIGWLQRLLRSTLFRADRTRVPILATSILLVAAKR